MPPSVLPTLEPPRQYLCPGDAAPIARSVHLARLAAGFGPCRGCPLREGEPAGSATLRDASGSLAALFRADGVRGVWRNEIDRPEAERFAAALAGLLWDGATGRPPAAGFPVVVGYDDRPWSATLAAAAGAELRRHGCESIDVGLATGPAFRFAVGHLEAAAGLLATGAAGGPAAAGFDFALSEGRPLSRGGGLDRLREFAERPPGRPTRRSGGRREFDAIVPYDAGLRRHLRSYAPVAAVVGTTSPLVAARLARLASELPARLKIIAVPRQADGSVDGDGPLAAIGSAVRETNARFGLRIDDDGTGFRLLDETGRPRTVAEAAGLLLGDVLAERPGATLAVDWPLAERIGDRLSRGGGDVARGGGTAEALFCGLRDHRAVAGADAAGRFWLPGPTADALVALARLLRIADATDGPFSAAVAAWHDDGESV